MKTLGYIFVIILYFFNAMKANSQVAALLYDSDNDGVADNSDAFPHDPTETIDTDGDRVGDNSDVLPNDPNVSAFSNPLLPSIKSFYESYLGQSITIDTTAIGGYPTVFTYQWYFNGFPISPLFGGSSPTYTIDGSESSRGTWAVEVTNDTGVSSVEFEYRVFNDTDSDGFSDYRESNILNTNPNLMDTDDDGLDDYEEIITYLTDPNDTDSDDDQLSDYDEINIYSTNPISADTSGDGLKDGDVVSAGFNPTVDFSSLLNHRPTQADYDAIVAERDSRPTQADYDAVVTEIGSKLSLDEVQDLRLASKIIEVSDNQATVELRMKKNTDLQTWEDAGEPATITVPADTDTKFFRFKMAD